MKYSFLCVMLLSGSALSVDVSEDRRQPRCKKPPGKPGQTLVKSCTDKEVCTLDSKNKAKWQTCPVAASGEDIAAMDSKLKDVDSKIEDVKVNLKELNKQHIEIIGLLHDIIGPTSLLPSTMVTPAAPVWRKVYGLDITGGPFANLDEAKKKNIDDPDANKFSILYDLETMKNADGVFHFKICYPELTPKDFPCNEWKQDSNPVTEQNIRGYSGITINYNTNGLGGTFQGLGLSPPSFSYNLIDAAPDTHHWYYSIGTIYNALAGPAGQPFVRIVELSVLYTPSG